MEPPKKSDYDISSGRGRLGVPCENCRVLHSPWVVWWWYHIGRVIFRWCQVGHGHGSSPPPSGMCLVSRCFKMFQDCRLAGWNPRLLKKSTRPQSFRQVISADLDVEKPPLRNEHRHLFVRCGSQRGFTSGWWFGCHFLLSHILGC